jgi:putative ABC transport system permease protein
MVSYSAAQRTQEIGIRMALGARPTQVLGQMLLSGMYLVSIGVVAGLVGAFSCTRLLEGLLFGVSAKDPITYGVVALGIVAVTFVANFLPASRASALDPMRALHFQ